MFCDQCRNMLTICREKDKVIGRCSCGFSKNMELSSEETSKVISPKGEGAINDKNILATYPHECKHCGHVGAEVIDLGVWYSDEAGNLRYRCGKCGIVESEKGGNS